MLTAPLLPKRVGQSDLTAMAGEQLCWYCAGCRQWRTSEITFAGVKCPVCGGVPDWKRHPPTLAYQSRAKRVADLCADGSPWRKEYDGTVQRYGDFIEATYTGLPVRTKEAGWRYFDGAWREVDKIADYLLLAPDAPGPQTPHVYSEAGLARRYYDPRRLYNVCSLSDLDLRHMCDDDGTGFTDQETVEAISLHVGFVRPFYDQYFADDFLIGIVDPLERTVAHDLAEGATKRDVERKYGLTERRVRTIVSHISKTLKKCEYSMN